MMNETILTFLEKSAFVREQIVKRLERSSEWSSVRKEHLKTEPCCALCGKDKNIQVHHKQPFSRKPELELDPENLITLCADHHLLFGHLGSWRSYNSTVVEDCDEWRNKIKNRPK